MFQQLGVATALVEQQNLKDVNNKLVQCHTLQRTIARFSPAPVRFYKKSR